MSATEENADGYWENRQIVQLNTELLEAMGGAWNQPPEQSAEAVVEMFRERASQVTAKLQTPPVWGWKDPRMCLTLPFWRALFPDLRLVVCLRSPLEVARSLNRRGDTVGYDDGLSLWTAYYERLLGDAEHTPCIIFTHYETYFYDAAHELKRLCDALMIPASHSLIQTSSQLVSTTLRHNASTQQLIRDANIPPQVIELYDRLCQQAGPVYQAMLADEAYQARLAENTVSFLHDELITVERQLSHVRRKQIDAELNVRRLEREGERLRKVLAHRDEQIETLRSMIVYRIYWRYVKPLLRSIQNARRRV